MVQSKLQRRALQRMSRAASNSIPADKSSQFLAPLSQNGALSPSQTNLRVNLPMKMNREELKRYKQMAVVRERQKRLEAKRQADGESENVARSNMNQSEQELKSAKAEAVRREKLRSVQASSGRWNGKQEKKGSKLRMIDRDMFLNAKEEAVKREKERRVRVSKRPVDAGNRAVSGRGGKTHSRQQRLSLNLNSQRISSAELKEYKMKAVRKEAELGRSSQRRRKSKTEGNQRNTEQQWKERLHQVFGSMADEEGYVNLVDLRKVLEEYSAPAHDGGAGAWTKQALQHLDLAVVHADKCRWGDVCNKSSKSKTLSAKETRRRAERMLALCRAGYIGLSKVSSSVLPEDLDEVLQASLRTDRNLEAILGGVEAPSAASVLPAKHVSLQEYEQTVCQLLNIQPQPRQDEKHHKKMHDLSVHVQTDSVYLAKPPPAPSLRRCNRGTQYTPVSPNLKPPIADDSVTESSVFRSLRSSSTKIPKEIEREPDLEVVDAVIRSLRSDLNESTNPEPEQKEGNAHEEQETTTEDGVVYRGRCWLGSQDLSNVSSASAVCAEVSVIQAMGPFRLYIRVVLMKNGQEGVRRIGITELTRLAKESSKQVQGFRPLVAAMRSACSEAPTLLTKPERARLYKSGVEKWTTTELERAITAEESIREWVESGKVPEQSTLIQWLLLHCVVRYDPENDQRRLQVCLPGDDDIAASDEPKPNRVGANMITSEEEVTVQETDWKHAVKVLQKGMGQKITTRYDQDQRNALIIAHNKLGVSGKRTISYQGFQEFIRHFCGEVDSSAVSSLSQKFVTDKPGYVDLHRLFFEVVDMDGFLDLWKRSVRGWKAWEINDVFQDYDASKSGMLSLGSFVSVLQEEMLMKIPYWKLVVLHYQFIVKGNLMSYRKFIKFIVKRLSVRAEAA